MSTSKSVLEAMEAAEARAQAKEATGKRINRPSIIANRDEIKAEIKAEKQERVICAEPKQHAADGATTFTYAQVQEMMAAMLQQNRESMIEFARELRKPDPEEQAKREEAKVRKERLMAAMIESAEAEIAERERMQSACAHRKPNGVINFGGQVHGTRVRLICKTCFKELVNRTATPEDIQQGPLELLVENQRMGLNS